MKCEKCQKDYPSKYYFKTETICNECYEKLSFEEKIIKLQQVPDDKSKSKPKNSSKLRSSLKIPYILLVISVIWIFLIHLEYITETNSSRLNFFDRSWLVGILMHPTNPAIWGAFTANLLINNLFNIPAIIIIFLNKTRKKADIIKQKARNAQILFIIIFLFTLIIS